MAAIANERLRTAMLRTGTSTEDLALCCGVDVKAVERWLSLGRVPHRANRWDAARRLGCDDDYLWPDVSSRGRRAEAGQSEVVRFDDQVLVNAHVYGNTAACAPVLHLRKVWGGSLVTVYLECIDRVWEQAKPWNGEDT